MTLTFLFGVHNHQPLGNFDEVIAETADRAYRPFFRTLSRHPRIRAVVHTSGLLLDWWEAHAPDLVDLVGELAARGQVEPLTGGLTEPILPLLPDHDKVGQIRALTDRVTRRLGCRPRGLWLAERVWEPHLARPLREAGVEYVLLDDHHFSLAGRDPDSLSGYYLTEEQGHTLAVFPISQRLRYLIPFAPVQEVLDFLRRAAAAGTSALTMVDDGEKFGGWPQTHRTVHEEGWLEAFLAGLEGLTEVEAATAGSYLEREPPTGRVYLPTASYREMGEWALDPEAGERLERAAAQLEAAGGRAASRLLRGGFWRNFLVRYPEVNDAYWKMLRLSGRIADGLARRPDDPDLLAARDALWRGQCNDAYWHGVFGGVYLPHLRRAVRSALLDAESAADRTEDGAGRIAVETGDLDGDGLPEVRLRSERVAVLLRPAAGGTVTELAYRPLHFDLADVLTRRPEHAHRRIAQAAAGHHPEPGARTIHETFRAKEEGLERLLVYDEDRRASLQEYLLGPAGPEAASPVDPVAAWLAFPRRSARSRLRQEPDGTRVELCLGGPAGPASVPVELTKELTLSASGGRLATRYALRAGAPLAARFAVRWSLALSGPAPDRYCRLPDGSRRALTDSGADGGDWLELVDDWLGLTARLAWSPPAVVVRDPVYTVSLSEDGLERIWQGIEITLVWPACLGTETWTAAVDLDLGPGRAPADRRS